MLGRCKRCCSSQWHAATSFDGEDDGAGVGSGTAAAAADAKVLAARAALASASDRALRSTERACSSEAIRSCALAAATDSCRWRCANTRPSKPRAQAKSTIAEVLIISSSMGVNDKKKVEPLLLCCGKVLLVGVMKPHPDSDGTQTQVGLFSFIFGEAPSSARLRCSSPQRAAPPPLPNRDQDGRRELGVQARGPRGVRGVHVPLERRGARALREVHRLGRREGGGRRVGGHCAWTRWEPDKGDRGRGDGASGSGGVKAPRDKIIEQPELRNNPFRVRLCEIFSSEPRDSSTYGDLSFDEFVDLYNVMSPRASKETKTQTAFRLYDFDGNGYLTHEDIAQLLKLLSTMKNQKMLFDKAEVKDIVDRVMRDCDIDGNNRLSYAEFSKVVGRIPDFTTKFVIYIQ